MLLTLRCRIHPMIIPWEPVPNSFLVEKGNGCWPALRRAIAQIQLTLVTEERRKE